MKKEELLHKMAAWLEKNPDEIYTSYDDSFNNEQIEMLLNDRSSFDDALSNIFCNIESEYDWSFLYQNMIDEFSDELMTVYKQEFNEMGIESGSALDRQSVSDIVEIDEMFHNHSALDFDDYMESLLRNTKVRIGAVIIDDEAPEALTNEGLPTLGPPNGSLDDEVNETRQAYLMEKFGIDGWDAESCYWHEELKAMGQLDLLKVYREGTPRSLTVTPETMLIFHSNWNGAGCLGDVKATKTVTVKARFYVDHKKYDIQGVYDFISEVWRGELQASAYTF